MIKIVGVTACPSGVAHTYMAAEALEKAAQDRGWICKIETQGSIGIENELTQDDIANADFVILTKDIGIQNEERFKGKQIAKIGISDVVKRSELILNKVAEQLNK